MVILRVVLADDLTLVRERVNAVAAAIQPLLAPHPGLAQRNAHAHIWLGLKVVFGEDWRQRATRASALEFLDWMARNPNAEYEAYDGAVQFCTPEEAGELF